MTSADRMKILTLLEEGKITAAEAERLLMAVNAAPGGGAAGDAGSARRSEGPRFPHPDLYISPPELGRAISGALDKVAEVVDRIPDKVSAEHLARVGKGVGAVVNTLTDLLDQGLSLLEASKYETFQFHDELTFADLEGLAAFRVGNQSGRVQIQAEDRADILVGVTAAIRAAAKGAAEDVHAGNPVVLRREGGTLTLSPPAALAEGLKSLLGRNRYDFDIRVPHSLSLSLLVTSMSGDVFVEGWTSPGTLSVKLVSGDVRVVDSKGELDVNAVSGGVAAENCEGSHRIRTVSGDITVDAPRGGTVVLASVSGDVRLSGELTATSAVKTVSGDVTARVKTRMGLAAHTTSGDLDISLVAGSGGYVDASSRSGDVEVDLTLVDAIEAKRVVKGRLDAGTEPLSFASVSGDVLVRRTDQ